MEGLAQKKFRLTNRKLVARLADKKTRDAFVERHVRLGIAYQLRALRHARGWTQKDVAKNSGVAQADVSKYESTEYGRMNISTLRKLASVYDVGLMVRFVPFSDVVRMEQDLLLNAPLAPVAFVDDVALHQEEPEPIAVARQMVATYQNRSGLNTHQLWRDASGLATLRDEVDMTRWEIIRVWRETGTDG